MQDFVVKDVVEDFGYDYVSHEQIVAGHINDTFKVNTASGSFILQKINTEIFKDPDGMMNNIKKVTEYLDSIGKGTYKVVAYKNPWRLITFIENTHSLDVLESPTQAYTAGEAFGDFQNDLSNFDTTDLVETIPNFHNTVWRLEQLDSAIKADKVDRLKNVSDELKFVDKYRMSASKILDLMADGKIPVRITHNDTKINNVLLDNTTDKVVAVIDLDTVMPGCSLYDFGDMVRTATASAQEDEKDLDKMFSRVEYFENLVRGYLSQAKFLNKYEIENMVFSGILITFTIGVRFLTDYLDGDNYYKTDYDDHNLVRAKTQFKLVQSIEEQYDKYVDIVNKYARSTNER